MKLVKALLLVFALIWANCGGEIAETEPSIDTEDGPSTASGAWCGDLPDGQKTCCGAGYTLRPKMRKCTKFLKGTVTNINAATMTYQGRASNSNFLPVDDNTLELLTAYVIENGEGTSCPHGPFGSLHFDFLSCDEYLPLPPDGANRRRLGIGSSNPRNLLLRGPTTHPATCSWPGGPANQEWDDDQYLRYQDAGIFPWGTNTCVVLRVWESDGFGGADGSDDGSWGRRNDVIGMVRIERAATTTKPLRIDYHTVNNGVWFPLYSYTNDHPRTKTSNLAAWVKVRTGKPCIGTCASAAQPRGFLACVDDSFQRCNFVNHACTDLESHHAEMNGQRLGDKISSIKLIGVNSVTLYEHAGYKGRAVRIDHDCPDLKRHLGHSFGDITSSANF